MAKTRISRKPTKSKPGTDAVRMGESTPTAGHFRGRGSSLIDTRVISRRRGGRSLEPIRHPFGAKR